MRDGSADDVLDVLRAGAGGVEFVETEDPATHAPHGPARLRPRDPVDAAAGDADAAVAALDRHRLLCAHRDGPFGVKHWNRQVEHWVSEATGDPLYDPMYVGRPLLVTANDYGLGVYNGDAGVVVQTDDGPRASISGVRGLVSFATSRMSDVETMFATTIHKSQGSQAAEVTVLLPPEESRLLTRELFYTAVTRATTDGAGGRHGAVGPRRRRPSGPARQRSAAAAGRRLSARFRPQQQGIPAPPQLEDSFDASGARARSVGA